MKKTLLTIASIGLSVSAFAQTNGKIAKNSGIFVTTTFVQQSITAGSSAIVCDTISTITSTAVGFSTAGTDTTTPGCSPKAGYVFGSNCYKDQEKANFFPKALYSNLSSPQIQGVIVGFYKKGTKGTGGASATTVGINIYSGTSNTVMPGTSLGSTVSTLGTIVAAQTNTASNLFYYTFNFASPINAPATGGFYASLTLPTTAGDTAVAFQQSSAPSNMAWEKESDAVWYDMSTIWGGNYSILMLPKMCGTSVSGISENLGLSKNITILPNPTTGLVNIAVILQDKENLNVSITNTLGQVLINNKYDGISNDLLNFDLSHFNNGVYFVTVSNGKDKMVQRLVLNK